ncbi:hypothetical protein U5801_28720, partial [Lamprobacter modestohalophilus]|uniref:hypothetical protein n=1 Tax=Lamprobacter modestohalophilus TaxID=1064514 RepID=UPI002ADEDC04
RPDCPSHRPDTGPSRRSACIRATRLNRSKCPEQATDEQLDTWVEQIFTANALDDLFATR